MNGGKQTSKIPLRKKLATPLTVRKVIAITRCEQKRLHPHIESLLKAYEAKDLAKVRVFLSSGLPVNYREPARAHRTPLLYAAKYNFVEAVNELLEAGADPRLADDAGVTPLHAAASSGSLNPLRKLLDAGVSVNVKDIYGKTPLHYASRALGEDEEDNAYNVAHTLLKAGATVSIKDDEDQTPLHTAAYLGNTKVLSLLLSEKGASLISERDKSGRTPLHQAVLGARSLLTVEVLLQYLPAVDARDSQGRTPLHYVAARSINNVDKEFDGDCLELLLSYGTSVQIKDNDGYNALSLALQRTMWWSRQSPRDTVLHCVQLLVAKGSPVIDSFDMWRIVETFPSLVMVALNQSIRANTSAKDSPHLKLVLDFRPLTVSTRLLAERKRQIFTPLAPADELPIPPPLLDDSEISMLHYIFWAGHKNILRHPLCSAFLHLKWLRVRKFFIMHSILYFLFVLTLTVYIMSLQNNNEQNYANSTLDTIVPNNNSNNSNKNNNNNNSSSTDNYIMNINPSALWVILLIFSILVVIKEILQIAHSPLIYIRHHENFMDIIILLCVLLLLFKRKSEFLVWQRNISAIAVIGSWSRLMLFLGQFPSCGVYIVMFSRVSKTVFRFLSMYLPLLIAFAFGFLIVLNEPRSFREPLISFVSTVLMMTGEIDYESNVLENEKLTSISFPCLILIIFFLLIAIILSNLLVALAVNDLNTIQQRSELLRLSRQVELMVTVEKCLKSPIVPKFLRRCLQKQFSILPGHTEAMVAIWPNKRAGYVERVFLKLLFIFKFRKMLTKIFEQFVVNFIPPDYEPSLPKSLVQEATQLALTELEIEKRDKFLFSKSHQIGSLRHRTVTKKQGHLNQSASLFPALPRRDSLQEKFKLFGNWSENQELDPLLVGSRQQIGMIQSTPSLKASLWRASIRKEAFRSLESNILNSERRTINEEIEQLGNNIMKLQRSVDTLTSSLSLTKPEVDIKSNSYPFTKPKLLISPLIRSFPDRKQSILELSTGGSDASTVQVDDAVSSADGDDVTEV